MKHTTLIFDCWERLYEALGGLPDGGPSPAWPAHPTTGDLPTVAFGGIRDEMLEMVTLPGRPVTDQATQRWITSGRPSKEEDFTLDVVLWTDVPGTTALEANRRLRELVAVVETALRDQVTGRPIDIGMDQTDGLKQWGVGQVVPNVYPLVAEGFGASCRIGVEFMTRL